MYFLIVLNNKSLNIKNVFQVKEVLDKTNYDKFARSISLYRDNEDFERMLSSIDEIFNEKQGFIVLLNGKFISIYLMLFTVCFYDVYL